MIYLYTENFCWWPRLKYYIKIILGRQNRGPRAVELSLMRGLKELGVEFCLNKKISSPIDVACVITGANALKRVIEFKRQGLVKKIVAGPIISILPSDNHGIIMSPEVDVVIMPSEWTRNWWGSLASQLAQKMTLWPAGVKDDADLISSEKKQQVLIFQKNAPGELLDKVIKALEEKGILYKCLYYGNFSQTEYFDSLKRAKFLIYLSQSESQGIALNEAWIRNVPTLVWNRGFMTYKDYQWNDAKVSAPYMTDDCGKFFTGEGDFVRVLGDMLSGYQNFKPRQYSLEHFTDKASAAQYLKIINQNEF